MVLDNMHAIAVSIIVCAMTMIRQICSSCASSVDDHGRVEYPSFLSSGITGKGGSSGKSRSSSTRAGGWTLGTYGTAAGCAARVGGIAAMNIDIPARFYAPKPDAARHCYLHGGLEVEG